MSESAEPAAGRVRLAWWGTAWLRGHVVADHLIDAVVDQRRRAPGRLPRRTAPSRCSPGSAGCGPPARMPLGAALPAEGDPVGLGGPADFNAAALEAGEAVVAVDAAGFALVPAWSRTGSAPPSPGRCTPADRRQLPDVGEADRALRAALPETADALAALEVARWRPEVADRLMNLRHRPPRRRAARRPAALRGAGRPRPAGARDRRARARGRRRRADRP